MRSIVGIFIFLGFLGTQVLLQAGPTNRPPVMALSATTNSLNPKEDLLQKRYKEYMNMTPDQRRAKLQARLTDLKKKETAGTITPAEKAQLKNLEDWMQRRTVDLHTNSVRTTASSTNFPESTRILGTAKPPAITTNKPPMPLPRKK
jgi:hypothetical protein